MTNGRSGDYLGDAADQHALGGILYVSEALVPFDTESLRELARRAEANNFVLGITGYLFFAQGRFVQYIEGESMAVEELMARIRYDRRHHVLTMLRTSIPHRRFPNWHMKRVVNEDLTGFEDIVSTHVDVMQHCDDATRLEHTPTWRMVDSLAYVSRQRPFGSCA